MKKVETGLVILIDLLYFIATEIRSHSKMNGENVSVCVNFHEKLYDVQIYLSCVSTARVNFHDVAILKEQSVLKKKYGF